MFETGLFTSGTTYSLTSGPQPMHTENPEKKPEIRENAFCDKGKDVLGTITWNPILANNTLFECHDPVFRTLCSYGTQCNTERLRHE